MVRPRDTYSKTLFGQQLGHGSWLTGQRPTMAMCHHNAQHKNLTVAFRQWCEDNHYGLTTMLTKFLNNEGKNLKQQYISADNGLKHDYNTAMALHKLHSEDNDVTIFNNKKVKIGDNG
eukprot:5820365-Amphidinium_carterae.1